MWCKVTITMMSYSIISSIMPLLFCKAVHNFEIIVVNSLIIVQPRSNFNQCTPYSFLKIEEIHLHCTIKIYCHIGLMSFKQSFADY